jgi:Predicted hydrolases or acyltransferases (alpha/beta hydrolase superfamily)
MAYVQIDDVRLAYDDVGSGPELLLVHGYPFNRSLWAEQVDALSKTFRLITPDLRGFGESEISEGVSTMNRMAQDVAHLMNALEISSAIVGGLSMGGYVVFAFYKQFATRVRGLVLANTRAQADTEEAKQVRTQQAEQIMASGMAGVTDAMLPKLLTPETVSKRPEVVKRIRDMMLKTKPAGAAAALRAMAAREDQTALLPQVSVPTLILVGREDPITPLQDSENMHKKIAGSRLVVIENASHVSNIEQSAIFNAELSSFLHRAS